MVASSISTPDSALPIVVSTSKLIEFNGKHFIPSPSLEAKTKKLWEAQLSKLDVFNIDISMVMVVALLWNQNTCALELPCGPVSPTLLNVVVITSLML
ncbi:hypothetical protein JHK82_055676 [Glycine max]|nr:hypothetical protein JHK85_056520 [Glycine max]KAG5076981.1 hypothetical protein JHK82_055676 [Glycine max]